jgi:hypothetical protein
LTHPARFHRLLEQLADHTALAHTAVVAGTAGTAVEDDGLYATACFYLRAGRPSTDDGTGWHAGRVCDFEEVPA